MQLLCRPIKLVLSAGNVNDIKIAPQLLDSIELNNAIVTTDKVYCSHKFLKFIEDKGGKPCIFCKKSYKVQWEIDIEQHKKRNVVERFFSTIERKTE